jgi:phosphoserine phosphatase
MIGIRKTAAIRQLAAEERVDLTVSSAYGDHLSDVPFLELGGDPVVCGAPGSSEWLLTERRGRGRGRGRGTVHLTRSR